MVDNLKETREFLYRLGNKSAKGALEQFLLTNGSQSNKNKKHNKQVEANEEEVKEGHQLQSNKWF